MTVTAGNVSTLDALNRGEIWYVMVLVAAIYYLCYTVKRSVYDVQGV